MGKKRRNAGKSRGTNATQAAAPRPQPRQQTIQAPAGPVHQEPSPTQAASAPLVPALPNPKATDIWLSRLSNLAQVGTLTLAIVGYTYTVKPIFQNQLLQEQASRLELDKKQSEKELKQLQAQQIAVQAQIRLAHTELHNAQAEKQALQNQASQLLAQTRMAETAKLAATRQLGATTQQLHATAQQLSLTLEKKALDAVAERYLLDSVIHSFSDKRIGWGTEPGTPVKWFDPYEAVVKATSDTRTRSDLQSVPREFWNWLDAQVTKGRSELTCTAPDFSTIAQAYAKEMRDAEARVPAELEKELEKWRADVKAKHGQEALVTIEEDARAQTERVIRVTLTFPIRSRYTDELQKRYMACFDVGNRWLARLKPELTSRGH